MHKILIVDDEERIRDIIRQYLSFEGFSYDEASDGVTALQKIQNTPYDLVVLDIMMPHLDGVTTLRKIRETHNTPVILLTAKGEEYDKVLGFDLGADDYVVKPFSPKELMSRIKAILKRVSPPDSSQSSYTFQGLTVNPISYEVKIDGKAVSVTPKEFEMLSYFIAHPRIVVTREMLLNQIWGYDFYGDCRTVDTHVKTLRNNLGPYRKLIKTVWGVGYKYEEY